MLEGDVGEGVETRGEKEGEEEVGGEPLELGMRSGFDSRELPDSNERLGKGFESLAELDLEYGTESCALLEDLLPKESIDEVAC